MKRARERRTRRRKTQRKRKTAGKGYHHRPCTPEPGTTPEGALPGGERAMGCAPVFIIVLYYISRTCTVSVKVVRVSGMIVDSPLALLPPAARSSSKRPQT